MTAPPRDLHARNRDFRWIDAAPDKPRRLSAAQIESFNARGFTIAPGMFSSAEIEAVTAAIDPLEADTDRFVREERGGRHRLSETGAITFTAHIVKRSAALRAFAAHPAIKDVCHDLIGDEVRLYWDQSVYKKSEKPREFPWHQDNGYTFIEPQQYLTLWIPLVDVDEENGCPWIAPGLHRLGTLAHWLTPLGFKCLESAPDAIAAPAKAGDAIVFSSLAPHRTGPNARAGEVRKAYILQYAPDGAIAWPAGGEAAPQNDPERQFRILGHGL